MSPGILHPACCPRCGAAFRPRSNKVYCTSQCAKAATRNATRGPSSGSVNERQRNRLIFDRLHRLNEVYYATPPGQRLGLLSDWLRQAREGNKPLGRILSNPAFFAMGRDESRKFCFRRSRAYPPVPALADLFCRRLLGCRVWAWVTGAAPEPETGEVRGDERQIIPRAYVVATTLRSNRPPHSHLYTDQGT